MTEPDGSPGAPAGQTGGGRSLTARSPVSVLLASDDAPERTQMFDSLTHAGYRCLAVRTSQLHAGLRAYLPHLLILGCPSDKEGLMQLRRVRRAWPVRDIPVILRLSSRCSLRDRIGALEGGADYCMAGAIPARELLARIDALMRMSRSRRMLPAGRPTMQRVLDLDPLTQQVTVNGRACPMGPTEFHLLRLFIEHPERTHSREELMRHLRGRRSAASLRTIDVSIRRLRQALTPHGYDGFVQTVRGSGYRFSTVL